MIGMLINSPQSEPGYHLKAMYVQLRAEKPKDAEMIAPPSGGPYFGTFFTALARAAQGKPYVPVLESLDDIEGDLDRAIGVHMMDLLYLFDDKMAGDWLVERLRWARGEATDSQTLAIMEARLLMAREDYEGAVAILEPMSDTLDREQAWIHENLAAAYEELGRFQDTERHLEQYLDYWPDDADALNFLGYLYAEEGLKLDRAESLLEKALDLDPDNPFYLDSLGWVYYKQGKADEAIDYISRAILGMDSDDAILRDHLGDAYLLKGDVERALEEWERAHRLDPELEGVAEKLNQYGQ
jgi:tetratricopeptide (TPR) repeat protein